MNELHLQDKFLVPFFKDHVNGLGYQEVPQNTVDDSSLIIREDLQKFVADTELNHQNYQTLLQKYHHDGKQLLDDLIECIQERSRNYRNMALFLNDNKSITLNGIRLHLFYTSDSEIHENRLFEQNIFSVVQELPYRYEYQGKVLISFRPDLTFFVNGLYLGYSELKSNWQGQSAGKNGRAKVIKDYFTAVQSLTEATATDPKLVNNSERDKIRKDALRIFEKAIHITATDIGETYVIRNIADFFDDAKNDKGRHDLAGFAHAVNQAFKPYPLLVSKEADKRDKLKDVFSAHYARLMLEKEILYYNFIEREIHTIKGKKETKNERGRLISPRPKQKYGVDKIMARIDEFLAYEGDDDYFLALLEKQLAHVSASKRAELIDKRRRYLNNKNVYSLLLQYAAGFGKSNVIGWAALQLKDLRRDGGYVYDKIMIVVDRLQLRGQIDSKMLNMNIEKKMYVEAHNRATFLKALQGDTRLVIVNLQKFGSVREMLGGTVLQRLAGMRIAFLIDEIHRSNSGDQHEDMTSLFDELQTGFDADENYNQTRNKKNLIVGLTATPSDHTLTRFGEFSGYAESEKLWVPFDSYTMKEAIEDGFILNPIKGIVPVAAKLFFDLPDNKLEGFKTPTYKDVEKQRIYENPERIDAIAQYIAKLLVQDVYGRIKDGRGQSHAKAMLAVYSIKAAIAYRQALETHYAKLVAEKRYEKYKDAPIYIVYSDAQEHQKSSTLNDGLSEQRVLDNFAQCKNGLIIVVAKLQTGFDEPKLHTLFLDKEIRGINAIQTISRVNRTARNKRECRIVDFSYENVNVTNIKQAFEHFSDVVVSDFDPNSDAKLLEQLFQLLRESDVYTQFFACFCRIYDDPDLRVDVSAFLDFESQMGQYIKHNPKQAADTKAKAAQYFGILNRIEHVIALDKKYSEAHWLQFWRKFNTLFNAGLSDPDPRDEIEVYFDNQIGIIELGEFKPEDRKAKHRDKIAEGGKEGKGGGSHAFSILEVIAKRNEGQEKIGQLIAEFEGKINTFFQYIREDHQDGTRLVVKIRSGSVPEEEIHADFGKIYRKYKLRNIRTVGDEFFKAMDDIVDKLCDDFENAILSRTGEARYV